MGAKTEETYPDHTGGNSGDATYGKVKFTFDSAGRMIRREDQKGDTVNFNHTMAGTNTSRNYRTKANSPSGTIADSDTFTFDNLGRMLTAVSGRYSNTVTMTYDSYGRLKDESLTLAAQTYTVTRAYDTRSRLTQLTYPNGSIVQRTYTNRSQLHTVKYLGTTVDTRSYDDGGRLNTSTYVNGAVVTFAYQADNLPTSIATTHAGSPNIGTYSYTWDANKNKTGETITSTMSGFGFSTGATGYDDEDRLKTWNRTNGTLNQAWTLSAVGNWDAFTSAGSTWNRTHSNAHEFTGFTGAGSGTLAYDVKGNQTSRPSTLSAPALNLDWNFDNQLRGADTNGSSGSLEVTFEYDALGRRVARSHSSGNVVYVHAGQQVIADYARGTAAASPSYRYVYADYVDEPILRHTGTGTTLPTTGDNALYYHRNQQYSIVGLTNAAGTLVERYSYTAYGTLSIYAANGTVRSSSTYANRYTYTGREWDTELRLYHFRARWYDPATGGFISRDPLGYVDGMSLYRGYFGVAMLDPDGTLLVIQDATGRAPSVESVSLNPDGTPMTTRTLPSRCRAFLVCTSLAFGLSHCGIEFEANGNRSFYHVVSPWAGLTGSDFCDVRDLGPPRINTPFKPEWYTVDVWDDPSGNLCNCIAREAKNIADRKLRYFFLPSNSCAGESTCNSNYTTRCILSRCGIASLLERLVGSAPGWNHRMKKCTSSSFEGPNCNNCICHKWETMDDDWCGDTPDYPRIMPLLGWGH